MAISTNSAAIRMRKSMFVNIAEYDYDNDLLLMLYIVIVPKRSMTLWPEGAGEAYCLTDSW